MENRQCHGIRDRTWSTRAARVGFKGQTSPAGDQLGHEEFAKCPLKQKRLVDEIEFKNSLPLNCALELLVFHHMGYVVTTSPLFIDTDWRRPRF